MTLSRDIDVVKAVIRSPRTAKMIFIASSFFDSPYTNFTQVKADLKNMTIEGYLTRFALSSEKEGRREMLYLPTRKASELVPELAELPKNSVMFRIPKRFDDHSRAIMEIVSLFERSAGELKDRVEILEVKRDGYFHAKVELKVEGSYRTIGLKPDYTILAELDGKVSLFFLELENRPRSVESVTPQSINKTFKEKLMKYKAFQSNFKRHSFIKEAGEIYGCLVPGFRVLIVTTKNEMNRNRLVTCARSMGYGEMFHFATIEEMRQANVFTDLIWSLTTLDENRKAALMESQSQNRYNSKTSSASASCA